MSTVQVTYSDLVQFYKLALENGQGKQFAELAMEWAGQANTQLDKLVDELDPLKKFQHDVLILHPDIYKEIKENELDFPNKL